MLSILTNQLVGILSLLTMHKYNAEYIKMSVTLVIEITIMVTISSLHIDGAVLIFAFKSCLITCLKGI